MPQEDPEQGGGPLWSIAFLQYYNPLLPSLDSVIWLEYTDVTLGSSQGAAVAEDVHMSVGQQMGLNVDISKCELITHPGCSALDPTLSSLSTPIT